MTEPAGPPAPAAAAAPALHDRRALLLAGGAAFAGAAAAALARVDTADAGHGTAIAYDTTTVMHLDVTNTTAGSTRVSSNVSGTAAFVGLNDVAVGISRPDGILGRTNYATSNAAGVAGSSEADTGGIGVLGASNSPTGVGVFGFSGSSVPGENPPDGSGVYGSGPVNGVFGRARPGDGVGVRGEATTGAAVIGGATSGSGVEGTSATGNGVRGQTTSGVGVLGVADAGGVAARFTGRTQLQGATEATGPVTLADSLAVTGKATLAAVQATGPLDAAGPATLAATLEVAGATTLAGGLSAAAADVGGAATVGGTLAVAGATTLSGGLTVQGAVNLPGQVQLGEGAKLDRLVLPKTSGVVTLARAAASVAVPNVPVGAGTLVVATLQGLVPGVWVAAAVPNAKRRRITIHLNKRARKGTRIAWMIVN